MYVNISIIISLSVVLFKIVIIISFDIMSSVLDNNFKTVLSCTLELPIIL